MSKKIFSIILISLFGISCSNILNIEEKPSAVERKTNFKIVFTDNSGFMAKLFNSNKVRNASVVLKSNLLGNEYHLTTDTNGVATINGILSDTYIITAERPMTEQEMLVINGSPAKNVKLVNKNFRIIDLNAASQTQVTVQMDMVVGSSPLVISEIYACGPPGSGLYYHDKYIEIFNNTDSTLYLDSIIIAVVYSSSYLGINYVNDPEYIHSKSIWFFPGNGNDYPIQPGQFVVCAEDAIDHRINAPNSVDLSQVDFEFYKEDAPDVDNPAIPNMLKFYQDSGNDWLIGGEKGALVIAKISIDSLKPYGDGEFLIPYKNIIDGVEYMSDPTQLDKKICNQSIDAGTTGGIQFYTGKSMQRKMISNTGRYILKDDNNSSVDFNIINKPTPNQY